VLLHAAIASGMVKKAIREPKNEIISMVIST
jgi:hypothetical protein